MKQGPRYIKINMWGEKRGDKRNGKSDSLDIRSSAEVSRKTL